MKFAVTQNRVELVETPIVNEGEYKATTCEFEFSGAYEGLTKKAIFTIVSTGDAYETPITDGVCDIPTDVLAKSKEYVTVGVYGYEIDNDENLVLRYSPTPARFQVAPGSYTTNVNNPSDVTPSQAEILEAQVQAKIDEVNDLVEDVEEKRDSGAFNGQDGADGKDGTDGADGEAATIEVGAVTTLDAGEDATVENAGTTSAAVFNFGIPKGEKGDTGETGATGPQGPQGETGADGQDGADGADGEAATVTVGTTTMNFGQASSSVTVTNSGTTSAAVLDFVFNFAFADGNNVAY